MNIKIISIINSVIFFLIIKISTVVAAEKYLEKEDGECFGMLNVPSKYFNMESKK